MTSEETQIRYFSRLMSDVRDKSRTIQERLFALAELVESVDRDQLYWKKNKLFVRLTPIKFRQLHDELGCYTSWSGCSELIEHIEHIRSELIRVADVYDKYV